MSKSMRNPKKVRVDFDIWPEEKKVLDKLAKKYRVTRTEVIRYLIRKAGDLPAMLVPTTQEEMSDGAS
ncbi:MAG: hypothetical protein Q8S00_32455 [Deltaproteobacteria bacterium]|nr:hypothetical protein [Deltaproteobacteria bacterium]